MSLISQIAGNPAVRRVTRSLPKPVHNTLLSQIAAGKIKPVLIGGKPHPAYWKPPSTDIIPTSQLQKMEAQRPPPPLTLNNFPENKLQVNRHYVSVAEARPNPANAFK